MGSSSGSSGSRHAVCMGLDIYVGPLTRYHLGDWLTIVQQAGQSSGTPVQVVRSQPEAEDKITDPQTVLAAVRDWQTGMGSGLGVALNWAEAADLPYWTDKPDWDGYGGVVLLAAYNEQPTLTPNGRKGLLGRGRGEQDDPRRFAESKAYKAAVDSPRRYVSLLAGVE